MGVNPEVVNGACGVYNPPQFRPICGRLSRSAALAWLGHTQYVVGSPSPAHSLAMYYSHFTGREPVLADALRWDQSLRQPPFVERFIAWEDQRITAYITHAHGRSLWEYAQEPVSVPKKKKSETSNKKTTKKPKNRKKSQPAMPTSYRGFDLQLGDTHRYDGDEYVFPLTWGRRRKAMKKTELVLIPGKCAFRVQFASGVIFTLPLVGMVLDTQPPQKLWVCLASPDDDCYRWVPVKHLPRECPPHTFPKWAKKLCFDSTDCVAAHYLENKGPMNSTPWMLELAQAQPPPVKNITTTKGGKNVEKVPADLESRKRARELESLERKVRQQCEDERSEKEAARTVEDIYMTKVRRIQADARAEKTGLLRQSCIN